jgi:SNF2 family DNA or RNA helicase
LIIDFRKEEKVDCEKDLMESIAAAIRQRKRIVAIQPEWQGTARTEKGEVQDLLERFISDVKKKNSIAGGADDEIHDQVLKILEMAQKEAEKNHSKDDPVFDKANQDEEDEDEDDDEGQTKKRKRGKKRDPKERLYAMKMGLREHMHKVRNLAKELRGRMQSLRYFEWVRSFQLEETELKCVGHGSSFCECQVSGEKLTRDKLGVLSSCGHVGCLKCLRHHADKEECIVPTCHVPVKYAHISSASDLGADRDHAAGGQYGAKLRAIVDKIKQLVQDGDRVIVFVQFDDLKEKVSEALQDGGVKSLQVKGTVQQQVKALNILQKEIPDKDDPRVLLLKMDDERSSGINLTTCNHAVFVHPLLADTQQQYDAYETQAIGRIRRYGQTKKVHIWRYLARDTIDTEIAEERLNIQPT